MTSETQFIKLENLKLRNYISLILAEKQLTKRIFEIRKNFTNSTDSERLVLPMLKRISRIKTEMCILEQDLDLSNYDDASVTQSKEQNSSRIL